MSTIGVLITKRLPDRPVEMAISNRYTGNLTQDVSENIQTGGISWTPYNKIDRIVKLTGGGAEIMKLAYLTTRAGSDQRPGPKCNRVIKDHYASDTSSSPTRTYYIRDAQGNVMGIFKRASGETYAERQETPIYGSSRLGVSYKGALHTAVATDTLAHYNTLYTRELRQRGYELTDHLGNVRATVSDMLIPRGSGVFDADLRTLTDYYPFGMTMPERSYEAAGINSHRYGYNGKENDNEVKGEGNSLDYGARIYDPRVGRWLSLDPLMAKYPGMSPYNFAANKPVLYVDFDGRDYAVFINHRTKTITIKATYHIVKGGCDAEMAKLGVDHWNGQNGKFKYVVGEGSNAKEYEIKFDLTVKEHASESARDVAFSKDRSGEGNMLLVKDLPAWQHGYVESGPSGGISVATIANSDEAIRRNNPAHELGHTLVGAGHWWKGLLKSGDDRDPNNPDDFEITVGYVTKILQNARIGGAKDVPHGDRVKTPGRKIPMVSVHPSGREPEDFIRGSVKNTSNPK